MLRTRTALLIVAMCGVVALACSDVTRGVGPPTTAPKAPRLYPAVELLPQSTTTFIGDCANPKEFQAFDSGTTHEIREWIDLRWGSADTTIAAPVYAGGFRGRRAGTTRIYGVRIVEPADTGFATLTVVPLSVSSERVDSTIEIGLDAYLFRSWNTAPCVGVSWTSLDTSIVRIDATGQIAHGVRLGTTSLRAVATTDTTVSAVFRVSVVPPRVSRIVVQPATVELHGRSDARNVNVSMFSPGGTPVSAPFTVETDSGGIAVLESADAGGFRIDAGKAGKARVLVKSANVVQPVDVIVHAGAPDSAVVMNGATAALPVGANDFDVPSAVLVGPKHGSASLAGGTLSFTAERGYVGRDSLTYLVGNASNGLLDTVRVRLSIAPGPYAVRRLDGPGGSRLVARDLNQRGDIAGHLVYALNDVRPFRIVNGQLAILANPFGTIGTAAALNDSGDVAGCSAAAPLQTTASMPDCTRDGPVRRSLWWPAGAQSPVDLEPSDTAGTQDEAPVDINNARDILLAMSFGRRYPRLWRDGQISSIIVSGCNELPRGVALNDLGDILIDGCGMLYYTFHVITTSASTYGSARESTAQTINNARSVLSFDSFPINGGGSYSGFRLYNPNGSIEDLVATYGADVLSRRTRTISPTLTLNDVGIMVGTVLPDTLGNTTGVLLEKGVIAALSDIVAPAASGRRWKIVAATRINNAGTILGVGVDPDRGDTVSVIISPPPGF